MNTLKIFPISGYVAAGFDPVRQAFGKNFSRYGEVGAAVHVTLAGEPVVDLWGGAVDLEGSQPWQANTLVNIWSSTKGCLALAMHMLADERGRLDFEAPVAQYWPEFAQNGKGGVLVRHVLTHTAGLPAPSMKVSDDDLYDWEAMIHALEKSTLFWTPGTKCGYHAASFGWLNGEILRRITGMSVGSFIRTEIAEPLGADIYVGLSEKEQSRIAGTIPPSPLGNFIFHAMLDLSGRARSMAFKNPPRPAKVANTARWREAEIPSSNGHASARGLARLYTLLALGGKLGQVRLLSGDGVELAGREQVHGMDIVTGQVERRTLGFMLPTLEIGNRQPPAVFGHAGMGGSIGFADPQNRLAMAYVMNKMVIGLDTRYADLARAVYACLPA